MSQVFNPYTGRIDYTLDPINGLTGTPGEKGDVGPQGIQGIQGLNGIDGSPGKNGARGPKGEKGDTGERGAVGQKGKDGSDGKDGRIGNQLLFTVSDPKPELGLDGDAIINAFNQLFFKENGSWRLKTVLSNNGPDGPKNLARLKDVTIANIQIGDTIVWDGSSFVNQQEDILSNYKIQLDKVDATTTYIGYAVPGALTSASSWKIKRTTTSGDDLSIEFADGDLNFDNVWDDRATLSYS